jgi:tRNA (cytidine/uridine-2'-O-)-methyltransferase
MNVPSAVDINVVLVEPEIPHNTGAIGRLCVGLGARLHLVEPLGFYLDDAEVRRCGLDYWPHLDLRVHKSWEAFLASEQPRDLFFASVRGERDLYEHRFGRGDYLIFGSETRGLPASLCETYRDRLYRIPMPGAHARSINLANAVSIAAYEAYRQLRQGAGQNSM